MGWVHCFIFRDPIAADVPDVHCRYQYHRALEPIQYCHRIRYLSRAVPALSPVGGRDWIMHGLWRPYAMRWLKFRELHVGHPARFQLAWYKFTVDLFFSQSSHFQYLDYNSVTYYMRNASFAQQSTAMLLCGALPLRFCPSCTDSYSLVFNALASFLKCLQHLRTAPWCKTSLSNIFIDLRLNCAALWPSRDKHFTIGRRLLTQRKLIWFSLK